MNNYGVSITFGRNVGDMPLTDLEWAAFIRGADSVLVAAVQPFAPKNVTFEPEQHYGVGVWDGVAEESCKLTIYGVSELVADKVIEDVILKIRKVGAGFGQNAVAVSKVQNTLVYC